MKKLLGLLTLTAALNFGTLMSAEALEHYDNNDTMSNIVFSDSLMFDKGLVGVYQANADGSRQVYFGKWNRQKNGLLNLIFQEKHSYNALNELTSKTLVSQNVALRKQGRQLIVVKQDGGDVVKGSVYHNGEYAWGNDAYMSKYMLQQYLQEQGIATEVKEIPALTRLLDEECRALVQRNLQNATGAGMWYEASTGQIYYVESDPKSIYVLKGRSLENLSQGEEMVRFPDGTAALARGSNRADVVMFKERSTEYYDIFFSPTYFIVEKVSADDPAVSAELQNEVGIRQQYGPNPRVNMVRNQFRCDL